MPRKRPPATGSRARVQPASSPPRAKPLPDETHKAPFKPARTTYRPKTPGPTSTESERLKAIHARLDRCIRASFPKVEPVFDYGMHGWRMPRLRRVEWTRGTMDPNYVMVGIAERASGITLHLWDPIEPGILRANEGSLKHAGFKVMVGCVQFNRKSEFPVAAVEDLLGRVAAQVRAEA